MRKSIARYLDTCLFAEDVASLRPGQWINDAIVEFQYSVWSNEDFADQSFYFVIPSILSLLCHVHPSEARAVLNDSLAKEVYFIPINDGIAQQTSGSLTRPLGSHWSLLVFVKACRSFYYFDSMRNVNEWVARRVQDAIQQILQIKGTSFSVMPCPQQDNASDCGIFILENTRRVATKLVQSGFGTDIPLGSRSVEAIVSLGQQAYSPQSIAEPNLAEVSPMKVITLVAAVLVQLALAKVAFRLLQHAHDSSECPLKKSGCPYYAKHKTDTEESDFLTAPDHVCPLAKSGCRFYEDVKAGKDRSYNWLTKKCPLAGTCPYFEDIKNDAKHSKLHHCPLLRDCPYYAKPGFHAYDASKVSSCPHFQDHGYHKGDAAKCPHLAGKDKDCPWLAADHKECPAADKCPYYQKIKDGKLDTVDLSKNDCPLAEKCPYYKEFKADPSKLHDCPMAKGCPHFHGKEKENWFHIGSVSQSVSTETDAKAAKTTMPKKQPGEKSKGKEPSHDEL
ncbi:SUMO1 sentrin specific peptidase 8 [Kappamyces sp. JEL0680]|nr:SUMO1 sentrin specific peptidase 8 [Kappamyces sp. JEL0680]